MRIRVFRRWGIGLAIAAATGVLAALMGPFGNYEHVSLGQRLIYWPAMALASVVIFGAPLTLIELYRPAWATHWPVALLVGVVGCLPLAVVTWLTATAMWPDLAKAVTPLSWLGECLVISVPVVMIFWLVALRRSAAPAAQAPVEPAPNFRGALCLQMEDHYVRVHGQSGSQLVLMKLSDAIARTGRPGIQVHRSWWVATEAIERAIVEGRNVRLRLTNGIEAPVARSAVVKVREAGLLPAG